MDLRKLLLAFVLVATVSLAIQPVSTYTDAAQYKYSPGSATAFTTEGGNVTNVNISQDVSTEKWAGIWGNITGTVRLSDGTSNFYTWSWTPSSGGTVCAQPGTSADFDWTSMATTTAGDVDNAFSFNTADVDSATNTLTAACSVTVSGNTVNSVGVTASGFTTCAIEDTGTPTTTDLAFCTDISTGTTIFNGQTADYALMLPTNEQAGQVQDYVFWLELS